MRGTRRGTEAAAWGWKLVAVRASELPPGIKATPRDPSGRRRTNHEVRDGDQPPAALLRDERMPFRGKSQFLHDMALVEATLRFWARCKGQTPSPRPS